MRTMRWRRRRSQSHQYCDKKVATILFEQLFELFSVVVLFSSKLFELIRAVVIFVNVVTLVGPKEEEEEQEEELRKAACERELETRLELAASKTHPDPRLSFP